MRVAHLLRKLDPAEWSGTEMAIQRLLEGLRGHGVGSVVYCPRLEQETPADPLVCAGYEVRRFRAVVPVLGLPEEQRRQFVSVGGNLMSFDLLPALWRDRGIEVIHSHTLGRLGGIGLTLAKRRRLPFVVTIHGGLLDLPEKLKQSFNAPREQGWEWGKLFGLLFRSHRVLHDADAILTCNAKEAALLKEKFPDRRISVQPHGVPLELYRPDHREAALAAFPGIRDRELLVCLGRVDPVKNQGWLLERGIALFRRHPKATLVLAGPCTDEPYGEGLRKRIEQLGLAERVLWTGGMPPNDPRLIGLLQQARALVLPSLSETFGLVILEAWAAGTMVVSARASGPAALIQHGYNGWLFDLDQPAGFHEALDRTLADAEQARQMVGRGAKVSEQYSLQVLAGRMKTLYEELIEGRQCAT